MKKMYLMLALMSAPLLLLAQPGSPATPAPLGGGALLVGCGILYGVYYNNKKK